MRLSRADKIRILRLYMCSSMTTAEWRAFAGLSRRGLVDIDRQGGAAWGHIFGVATASLQLTPRGRELGALVIVDATLWGPVAEAHDKNEAARVARGAKPRPCTCWACWARDTCRRMVKP